MVNHDISQNLRLAQRIIVFRDGMTSEAGRRLPSTQEILTQMSGVDGTPFRMKELTVA